MKLPKIEIGHLYVIFSTVFGVSASMHRQSPLSRSANDIVYGIEKYAGFLHVNDTPSLVFVRISPLKYITIFALIFSSFSILYYSLYSPLFFLDSQHKHLPTSNEKELSLYSRGVKNCQWRVYNSQKLPMAFLT